MLLRALFAVVTELKFEADLKYPGYYNDIREHGYRERSESR